MRRFLWLLVPLVQVLGLFAIEVAKTGINWVNGEECNP